jgi:molybdopterin-binding protein
VSTPEVSNLPEHRGASRTYSSRNRLEGTIVAVKKGGLVAEVEMVCGPYRIVSLMSREAADELDLGPGVRATAIVKSAAVFIEPADRPAPVAIT